MTSLSSVTKVLMAPPIPAGTIAAFATILPSSELSVETKGLVWLAGQNH
jgi:hypothetical protein